MVDDRSTEGVSRRDFALGFVSGSALIGAAWGAYEALGTVSEDLGRSIENSGRWFPEDGPTDPEDSDQSMPSSELVSADGSVYDKRADMCGIDLIVDVAENERVVIQNDMDGGTDRTVQNSGERSLRTHAPADSSVLIYAVDLDANTSKTLETYRVSQECTLSEATNA